MKAPSLLAITVLISGGTLWCVPPTHAQLPRHVEKCLPYPTFAQEVDTLYSGTAMKAAPAKKIVIDSVEFEGPVTLPMADQAKLVEDLKSLDLDETPDWLDRVLEVSIRGAWQDAGYFKISARGKVSDTGGDALHRHVALRVTIDEGLQYFQGQLTFRSADPGMPLVLTPAELSEHFPLKEGDVFDADKIRASLSAYRKLYAARGYIDFSAVPVFNVHDDTRRIDLSFDMDQGKQFRVERISVDGLDPRTEGILRDTFKPGNLFNYSLLQKFMDQNKSVLPPDASLDDNLHIAKNVKAGTVSMRFDFSTCPNSAN